MALGSRVSPLAGAISIPQATTKTRLTGIDALRGLAMIAMALDHAASAVRTSLQAESYGGQPAILENWTHWVSGLFTNLAAPTFWLLSGISLALYTFSRRKRGWSEWEITRFLLTRAGVLILLDLTVSRTAWAGQGPYLHVLLSIGVSLAIISVLRLLPLSILAILMAAVMLGYQLLLPTIAPLYSNTDNFWLALALTYSVQTDPAIEYSLLGWAPLMGLGFVLGQKINAPTLRRWESWVAIGAALLSGGLALRLMGGFGDLTPYAAYSNAQWYHWLILSKTPPSLTYLMFNLGLAALILAAFLASVQWLERIPGRWLVVIGQVALFFFIAHVLVYNLVSQVIMTVTPALPSMVRCYIAWLIGLTILVPVSYSYRSLRRRYPNSLLRYL